MDKIIAIGGQTGSGKTDFGIKLASEFDGEIINADSRQVYKGLNIGTAKGKVKKRHDDGSVNIDDIKHWLVDVVEPDKNYTLADFQKDAFRVIDYILERRKLPILVGGTGLYIDAVLYNYDLSNTEPDEKLRAGLKQLDVEELQKSLESINAETFKQMTPSDKKNPHRLMRAIERKLSGNTPGRRDPKYECLYICIDINTDDYFKRLNYRVDQMFESGLVQENRTLREHGYTRKDPGMKTIGYQEFDDFFEGKKTEEQVREDIKLHTKQYAKRQNTWFKRNDDIVWVKNYKEAKEVTENFLDN
jgi:tRNA dimethylallyltransferase